MGRTLGLVANELDQGGGVGVDEAHASVLAADLVEGAAQRADITIHDERARQAAADGAEHTVKRSSVVTPAPTSGWRASMR